MREDKKEYLKRYQEDYYKKKKRINITISQKEYKEFKKIAEKENLKVSSLVKQMAIAYKEEKYLIPYSIESKLSEFVRKIRGIANNVNQIAYNTNIFSGYFNTEDFFKTLKSLEDQVTEFINNPSER